MSLALGFNILYKTHEMCEEAAEQINSVTTKREERAICVPYDINAQTSEVEIALSQIISIMKSMQNEVQQ